MLTLLKPLTRQSRVKVKAAAVVLAAEEAAVALAKAVPKAKLPRPPGMANSLRAVQVLL
jgi:hypothetical protein